MKRLLLLLLIAGPVWAGDDVGYVPIGADPLTYQDNSLPRISSALPHIHAKIIYLDEKGNPVGWGDDVQPLLPNCEQGCGTLTIIPDKPGPIRVDTSTNIPVYFDENRKGRAP